MGKKKQEQEKEEVPHGRKVRKLRKIRKQKLYIEEDGEYYDFDDYQDMFMTEEDLEKLPHDKFTCFNIPSTKEEHQEYIKTLTNDSDILLVVVDSRDPIKTQPNLNCEKETVLILNKADLVSTEELTKKVGELSKNKKVVVCSTYLREKVEEMYDKLVQIVNEYKEKHKDIKQIKCGIVGYPEVGKGSIIQSLKLLENADCYERYIYFDEDKRIAINSIPGTVQE